MDFAFFAIIIAYFLSMVQIVGLDYEWNKMELQEPGVDKKALEEDRKFWTALYLLWYISFIIFDGSDGSYSLIDVLYTSCAFLAFLPYRYYLSKGRPPSSYKSKPDLNAAK